jgi:PIN domain nuclease of toxin-antitoxin system
VGGIRVILLDTHVIIWDALEPQRLSPKAQELIIRANETDGMIFCEISLWEIAMLIQKERVSIDTSYLKFIQLLMVSNKYIMHGISPEIADLSTRFPANITKDPADRLIAATTIIENATLVTADKNMRSAKAIPTAW